MSKFYGTVVGNANTAATRRGTSDIRVCAQSYDGSLITNLSYDRDKNLMVSIEYADDSATYGRTLFYGTMDALLAKLGGDKA